MSDFIARKERVKAKKDAVKEKAKPIEDTPNKVATSHETPWYRRKNVIIGGSIGLACLVVACIASMLLASAASAEVREGIDNAKSNVESLTHKLGSSEDKNAAMIELSTALEPVSCTWGLFPALGSAAKRCNDYNTAAGIYRTELEKVRQLFMYDEYVKKALGEVKPGKEVANYLEEQQKFQELHETLKVAPSEAVAERVRDDFMQNIQNIERLWGELAKADTDKNEEVYNEKSEELAASYDALQRNASELMHAYDSAQYAAFEALERLTQIDS